jgi:hypothetical protein
MPGKARTSRRDRILKKLSKHLSDSDRQLVADYKDCIASSKTSCKRSVRKSHKLPKGSKIRYSGRSGKVNEYAQHVKAKFHEVRQELQAEGKPSKPQDVMVELGKQWRERAHYASKHKLHYRHH